MRSILPKTKYRATKDHTNPKSNPNWISLRDIAKNELKITVIGEIFNADHLKELAEHIGLKAEVKEMKGTIIWRPVITKAIDSGKYVIAPFGVNPANGQPLTTGINAHFCVIYAYALWRGSAPKTKVQMPFTSEWWLPTGPTSLPHSYVMVRHWDKNRRFRIKELRESSQALKKFPKQIWQKQGGNIDYDEYTKLKKFKLPGKKVTIPEFDLPKTLAGRLVVVGKK